MTAPDHVSNRSLLFVLVLQTAVVYIAIRFAAGQGNLNQLLIAVLSSAVLMMLPILAMILFDRD